MSIDGTKQYRTLGEGDRRLPGAEYDEDRMGDWKRCPARMIGAPISECDVRHAAYRAPCSATVAPDGYEVVAPSRLPHATKVGEGTWMRWREPDEEWTPASGGWAVPAFCSVPLAAPADELAALYAAGDAERASLASEIADAVTDGLMRSIPQPATAPASPRVSAAVRQPAVDEEVLTRNLNDGGYLRLWARSHGEKWTNLGIEWLDLAAVDRLAAEVAELRRITGEAIVDRDAYKRERDLLRVDSESANRNWAEMVRQRDEARAEVARLRGELSEAQRERDNLRRDSNRLVAASRAFRAALEGRDG